MSCPVCHQRKGRRQCPALAQSICPTCCGTKRLVEINCPDSCAHLAAARANPAAVVRKQQEVDATLLMPTIQALTERQYQLFFLFHSVIARHQPEGFARLVDDDVADAAGTVAATLETAAKGVIYEHAAASPVARRLAGELTALLAQIREQGATLYDREAAITLRAIEQGAKVIRLVTGGGDAAGADPTAYLSLMGRLLQVNRAAGPAASGDAAVPPPEAHRAKAASSIILP
jgi:hypothetical protein